MGTTKISIKTGSIVEGNDFYGREKELQYAWNLLKQGNSLILSAPRRVGKSSFSKRLIEKSKNEGWEALYIDLQEINTEEDFVKLFIKKFQSLNKWESLKSKVGDIAEKISKSVEGKVEAGAVSASIGINTDVWKRDVYDKLKELIENAGEVLIVVDELTIFLNKLLQQENGKNNVEDFLNWLRGTRISSTKVRWIFCSSVGIENFASMHSLSYTLNDIKPFDIGAFTNDEAKSFIPRLDVQSGFEFSEQHINYILNKLKWHLPFFIQIIVEKIDSLIFIQGKNLNNEAIDEAYQLLITEKHFNTWDERLKEYYEIETYARLILKTLSAMPEGKTRDNLLADLSVRISDIETAETVLARLLDMLKNDGYLVISEDKYTFRSPLLRDFWFNRFVK